MNTKLKTYSPAKVINSRFPLSIQESHESEDIYYATDENKSVTEV